jgi:hypothetical protein
VVISRFEFMNGAWFVDSHVGGPFAKDLAP